MIITYLRSSSYGKWDMCPMQYWMEYVLGWRSPSGKKACLGNIVHKALESLARKKLAIQNSETTFKDDEMGLTFNVESFEPEQAIETAFELYSKKETHHEWTVKDFQQTRGWMYDVLALNGGLWNPLNREIVQPEQYFDIPIDKDWARYNYELPDGRRIEGQLAIKGTVDLITRIDTDTIQYLDWKTGLRKDWATGEIKTWKKLRNDAQLRMYYYALTKLYPEVKYIIMSIIFVQDGGAFSLDFGPKDIEKTEKMLKDRFETIKNCQRPPRIINNGMHKWKCARLCHFGKNNFIENGKDTGKTICNYMQNELITLGMDRAISKHCQADAFSNYGSGGGSSNRDSKKEE